MQIFYNYPAKFTLQTWALYLNRAQIQFVAYYLLHMYLFFWIKYMGDLYCCQGPQGCFPLKYVFAIFDEIMAFCIHTAFAIIHMRNVTTVTKWEFLALLLSWCKSVFVLWRGAVGFPIGDTDLWVFILVRFLVFGGLYKMVSAGLDKHWEAVAKKDGDVKPVMPLTPKVADTTVADTAVAGVRREVAGRGEVVGREMELAEFEEMAKRREYWNTILGRGW